PDRVRLHGGQEHHLGPPRVEKRNPRLPEPLAFGGVVVLRDCGREGARVRPLEHAEGVQIAGVGIVCRAGMEDAALGDHPSIMPPEGSTACRKRPDTQRTAVTVIDAWTREDVPALAWYRARGFAEAEHYLHGYQTWGGMRSRP